MNHYRATSGDRGNRLGNRSSRTLGVRLRRHAAGLATLGLVGCMGGPPNVDETAGPLVGSCPPLPTIPVGSVGPQFDPLEYETGAAGTADGQGSVEAGQFNYDIQLVLPPGRARMTPQLRLAYNSSAGNGLLGVGWSISGAVSQVHQCYKNLARDGEVRGITSSQSAFCLDGELLVPTEEDPPSAEVLPQFNPSATTTVYRTEHDRNVRVIGSEWWEPNAVEAHRRWVVMHPGGLVDIYGEGQAEGRGVAQVDGPDWTTANGPRWYQGDSKVLSWYRNERRDRSGNRIQYHYERDVVIGPDEIGAFYPSGVPTETASRVLTRITYGHAMSGTGVQPREVRFEYDARPDILESWRATLPLITNVRLRRIRMMAPESNSAPLDTVRTYELDYTDSPRSGRSLVTSISTCDGTGVCLPATTFEYPSSTFDANLNLEVLAGLDQALSGEQLVADFDGDGSDDLLRPGSGTSFETVHWDAPSSYGQQRHVR